MNEMNEMLFPEGYEQATDNEGLESIGQTNEMVGMNELDMYQMTEMSGAEALEQQEMDEFYQSELSEAEESEQREMDEFAESELSEAEALEQQEMDEFAENEKLGEYKLIHYPTTYDDGRKKGDMHGLDPYGRKYGDRYYSDERNVLGEYRIFASTAPTRPRYDIFADGNGK